MTYDGGRCKDCRHWESLPESEHSITLHIGECHLLSGPLAVLLGFQVHPEGRRLRPGERFLVTTKPYWGCRSFEARRGERR